jgi:hypothetical protein
MPFNGHYFFYVVLVLVIKMLSFQTQGIKIFVIFCLYLESSYTLKLKIKLFLVFLTIIIIRAAEYGNEFRARIKTTKKK